MTQDEFLQRYHMYGVSTHAEAEAEATKVNAEGIEGDKAVAVHISPLGFCLMLASAVGPALASVPPLLRQQPGINAYNPAALRAMMQGDFAAARLASAPGGIEAQEAAGQQSFVASTTLPRIGTVEGDHLRTACRAQLEALGFVFGEIVGDLFVQCQLPTGWQKKATEHSMWNELFDGKGHVRAEIFYKAAFYDRNAHIDWNRRYQVVSHHAATPAESEHQDMTDDAQSCYYVQDNQTSDVLFVTGHHASRGDWELREQHSHEAADWLKVHFPDTDPFAYWEDTKERGHTLPEAK